MNATIGELITAGSTNDTALTITNAPPSAVGRRISVNFLVEIVSGTIKLGRGGVSDDAHGFGAGSRTIITCNNGELHFKAASAADTFTVSYA